MRPVTSCASCRHASGACSATSSTRARCLPTRRSPICCPVARSPLAAPTASPTPRRSRSSLLQGPSAAGAWCAVVGVPDLGVEAAAGLGIDLERLVLVPHPGEQWLSVVSALVDVVSIMLVRPPVRDGRVRITDGSASKLASRLRQREAVLVSLGDWPGAERPPHGHRQQLGGARRGVRPPHRASGDRQLDGRRAGRAAPSHAGSGCPAPIRRSPR